MKDRMLSEREAFRAARYFLEQFNEREKSEALELLIGWMEERRWDHDPMETADPAQWHDWSAAVDRVVGQRRSTEGQSALRAAYDPDADAAYIDLTGVPLLSGRDTVPVDNLPDDVRAMVVLDFKDGKLVGVEVIGARSSLHSDLLEQGRRPGHSSG